ncbi:MAG: DUF2460 domain-containing protein [Bryobacteraceae bacterium]
MPTLPLLKTGAVMQYPAQRDVRYRTYAVRFVDGGEQRYREYRAPLRRWIIQLELLDESELAALEEFFVGNKGQHGSFSFTDPNDNVEYADCSLDDAEFALELQGELRGRTALVVRENRS